MFKSFFLAFAVRSIYQCVRPLLIIELNETTPKNSLYKVEFSLAKAISNHKIRKNIPAHVFQAIIGIIT